MALTDFEFEILDAMMDDCEDIEQVYLAINRESLLNHIQNVPLEPQ